MIHGETKQNFTVAETTRNETKFCEIFCFAKHAKFRETDDEFRIVSCFAKLKKHAKLETLRYLHLYSICNIVFLTNFPCNLIWSGLTAARQRRMFVGFLMMTSSLWRAMNNCSHFLPGRLSLKLKKYL
jgi:hypothetical protein